MLNSILELSDTTSTLTTQTVIICTIASLFLGVLAACIYMYHNTYTKSFVMTLALLPAMVQIVIMLVNGNLGTGIAVLGAFSLVRFRSVPGSAREIGAIFFAMAIGLSTGMGYIGYAVLFLIVIGLATILISISKFGEITSEEKDLKITIPENLDYTGIFDDLFAAYTKSNKLLQVKTSNMGSLYELHYRVALIDPAQEKKFIDALRCRNGNLNICCGRIPVRTDEL
ncbi:MAG: DUF4956 domain-containing protein [bacterium]|nr:DUF4956 domain-containing protein [bacterium]